MNTINQMKNIIVLKNLPSNIIEEALVILKPNMKVKVRPSECNQCEEKVDDYIVKEAEMVINNYLSHADDKNIIKNHTIRQMELRYKKLKKITIILFIAFVVALVLGMIN